ncbi:TniQ family protein [Streptomyces sp. NPDC047117]|uniref:TniQ family protein n=1 Tax=Streptomyces sp. NPDC047117 TaxID=3155379 RepID=UPI0033FC00BC
MKDLRTLPIRVLPLPGESMDSWLEALARRCWTSLSSLVDALDLPRAPRTHYLVAGLAPQVLSRLEKQLEMPRGGLEAAALPTNFFGLHAPHWRFCPECLHESQGRWPTRWWLPWSFACIRHRALLQQLCPGCQAEPRNFLPRSVHRHPPGHCLRATGRRSVCGTDLSGVSPLRLGTRHPILQAQQHIDALPTAAQAATDTVYQQLDQCLSSFLQSLTLHDLQNMEPLARSVWERAYQNATCTTSGLGRWRLRERERRVLTPEYLHREYTEGDTSLSDIAKSHNLVLKRVLQHVKDLGITIRRGQRPHQFDDDWLREQYLDRTRSAEDIGEESGVCGTVVLHRLEELGVPRRPSGVYSRPAMHAKLDESVPRDIRAAVEGTLHGWLRLRRFQVHMAFPTLSAAADYCDLTPGALAMQLGQLEQAIGADLFERSVRHSPQRPTHRGIALLQDLNSDQVQELMRKALGARMETMPNQEQLNASVKAADGERSALTLLSSQTPVPDHLSIPSPLLPMLQHLFANRNQRTYAAQIHAGTGIPFTTVFKQLKRLKENGWLNSQLEAPEDRLRRIAGENNCGRRRTYYSLTPAARQLSFHQLAHAAQQRKTAANGTEPTTR